MNQEFQALLDDPRFLRYHAETTRGRKFNPFDVLRYADYEIRHSNVLAWLFQPDETHGVGDAFLRGFTSALNDAARSQGISAVSLPSSFDAADVRVERELDYVDITLFFKNERVVIAIENKMGETSPEHAGQVIGYEGTLREKYSGVYDRIQSVLLTTSTTADASERRFIHLSWTRIRDIVKSIRDHGRFKVDEGNRVRAFLDHYLEIVERFAARPDSDSEYSRTLLDDYRPLLERLLKEREGRSGGADEGLPENLGEYRGTVDRLIRDFRQEPKRLRSAILRLLKGRGFRAWTNTPAGSPWFFLYFSNEAMDVARKSLSVPGNPRWVIFFSQNRVLLYLQFDPPTRETAPVVDRITEFMKETPIDASPERVGMYPMDFLWGGGRLIAYKHTLMTAEELSATPAAEIEDVTLSKMSGFLDVDFRRIETYLKCMAFDPAVPA